jgi:opacity protein-like surface antigen
MGVRLFVICRLAFYSHAKAEKTMKELVAAFLVCSSILFASTVWAQDTDSGKQNYFGVTAGQVLPRNLDSYDRYPGHISLSDVALSNGSILGVKVGHSPKGLAKVGKVGIVVEVEAFLISGTDVKGYEHYYMRDGAHVNLNADISVTAMMLNFRARDPYGQGHPYVGFGMGWTQFAMKDVELSVQEWTEINDQGDVDDDTFAFQVLLGVEFDLTRTLSLDLGYRYLRIEPRFEFRKEGWADLNVKMTYQTQIFTVGLNHRF